MIPIEAFQLEIPKRVGEILKKKEKEKEKEKKSIPEDLWMNLHVNYV